MLSLPCHIVSKVNLSLLRKSQAIKKTFLTAFFISSLLYIYGSILFFALLKNILLELVKETSVRLSVRMSISSDSDFTKYLLPKSFKLFDIAKVVYENIENIIHKDNIILKNCLFISSSSYTKILKQNIINSM